MTALDLTALLDEARALDASATPGPWTHDDDGEVHSIEPFKLVAASHRLPILENGAFIARSRTLLPTLAAAVERLQAERDALADCGADHATACGGCVVGMHHMMSAASKAERERDAAQQIVRDKFPETVAVIREQRDEAIARATRAEAECAALMPVYEAAGEMATCIKRMYSGRDLGALDAMIAATGKAAAAHEIADAALAALKETP